MTRLRSFAPIADKRAEILILGSMPGSASLAAGQYYAHAQNAFWRIMAELLQLDAGADYASRVHALKAARIALWDVLHSCRREGSLDARIESATQVANDFRTFFRSHRKISQVFFNGATAETCFKRLVLPTLDNPALRFTRLPSTSPAHATLSYAQKLGAWRVISELSELRGSPGSARRENVPASA
ncbi:MAG: DNA-deoxyinosine glycosylase [Sterolibacterium sp.]